jgi:hypothetical protein
LQKSFVCCLSCPSVGAEEFTPQSRESLHKLADTGTPLPTAPAPPCPRPSPSCSGEWDGPPRAGSMCSSLGVGFWLPAAEIANFRRI